MQTLDRSSKEVEVTDQWQSEWSWWVISVATKNKFCDENDREEQSQVSD